MSEEWTAEVHERRDEVRRQVARELWAWGWYDLADQVAKS